MIIRIHTHTEAQDSFHLEFITDLGCERHFDTEAFIRNDAGWNRDHMGGVVFKTTDLRSISELESEIKYIKGELKKHPNRDRDSTDLDYLFKAGSRLFRDEVVRFEKMSIPLDKGENFD